MDLKICLSGSILEKCWCPFPVIVWFKHNKHALSLTEKCPFSLQTQLCWTLGLCWNRNLSLTSHVLSKQQDTSNEQKSEDIENWVIYAQCSALTNILYNVVSEWAPLLLCVSLHHVLALAKGRGAVTGYSRTPLLNTSRFLINAAAMTVNLHITSLFVVHFLSRAGCVFLYFPVPQPQTQNCNPSVQYVFITTCHWEFSGWIFFFFLQM